METELLPSHPSHRDHVISTGGLIAERIWYPDVPILESVKNELLDKWTTSHKELCGFIDSDWNIHEVTNVHEYPARNFYMHEDHARITIQNIYEVNEDRIIAVWHTHPNDVVWPSPRDIAGWPNPALGWRYLIVTSNDLYEWELSSAA